MEIRHVSVTYNDFLLKFRQALTVLAVRVHRKWGKSGFVGPTPGVHFDSFFPNSCLFNIRLMFAI